MADVAFNQTGNELANSDFLVVVTSCTITTLLIYDHVLTLGREITYIWSRGWSRSCILFFPLRYTALLHAILLVFFHGTFPGLPISAKVYVRASCSRSKLSLIKFRAFRCQGAVVARLTLSTATLISAAVFPGLRVYALYQKKWIAILVSFLNMLSPVELLIQASQSGPGNSPLGVYHIAARVSTMLAETIVLVLTWIWGRGDGLCFWRSNIMSPLRKRILLDTFRYSGVVLLVHVISLAMIRDVLHVSEMAQGIQAAIVISTTRFMLDLHETANPHIDTDMSRASLSLGWGVERSDDDLSSFEV